MEGLASGALEAVIGVGRMNLADYHPHLQCDLDRTDCILTVCLHLYHHKSEFKDMGKGLFRVLSQLPFSEFWLNTKEVIDVTAQRKEIILVNISLVLTVSNLPELSPLCGLSQNFTTPQVDAILAFHWMRLSHRDVE